MPLGAMKQLQFESQLYGWYQAAAIQGVAAAMESGQNVIFDVAVDSSGNTYVAGSLAIFSANGTTIFVAKYDSTGAVQWYKNYDYIGTSGFSSVGYAITFDSSGNVYITGGHYPYSFVLKLDTSGTTIWQRFINESSSINSLFKDIAVFGSNVAIVGGRNTTFNNALNGDYAVYNTDGVLQASRKLTQTGSTNWNYVTVSSINTGNVYIGGDYTNTAVIRSLLTKFDTSNNILWTVRGPTDSENSIRASVPKSTATDSGIYVVGVYYSRVWLAEIDSNGAIVQQVRLYNNADLSITSYGLGITTDSSGNIYVTTYSGDGSPVNITKLNSSFAIVWSSIIPSQTFGAGPPFRLGLGVSSTNALSIGGKQNSGLSAGVYASVISLSTVNQAAAQTVGTTNANLTVRIGIRSNAEVSSANLTFAATTLTVDTTAFANITGNLSSTVRTLNTGTASNIALLPSGA